MIYNKPILNSIIAFNLKILTGDKSIYLYKPNDWNKYLYYKNDANIAIG